MDVNFCGWLIVFKHLYSEIRFVDETIFTKDIITNARNRETH